MTDRPETDKAEEFCKQLAALLLEHGAIPQTEEMAFVIDKKWYYVSIAGCLFDGMGKVLAYQVSYAQRTPHRNIKVGDGK